MIWDGLKTFKIILIEIYLLMLFKKAIYHIFKVVEDGFLYTSSINHAFNMFRYSSKVEKIGLTIYLTIITLFKDKNIKNYYFYIQKKSKYVK